MDHKFSKSKSLSSLASDDIPCHGLLKMRSYNYGEYRRMSDSSVEVFMMNDSASEVWCDEKVVHDSGLGDNVGDGDVVELLERKLDKLNELFQEQCQLLSSIKQQMHTALFYPKIIDGGSANYCDSDRQDASPCEDELQLNQRARSLLDAIEKKQASCLDRVVKDALADLLNSDELKQQLVNATVSQLRDKMAATLSRDMAAVYLPLLQRFNRKLLRVATRTLEDAFAEQDNSNMSRFASSAARALRSALDAHRCRVDAATAATVAAVAGRDHGLYETIKTVLKRELSHWRSGVLWAPPEIEAPATPAPPAIDDALTSPPQPPNPDTSIIDQLMRSAEIKKQIQEGDIAGSLTRALCANDLSLVVAACRGIDPERVFRPCTLPANILLSLVQQLATDMVHDTQLKCRYLEESLIALSSSESALVRPHIGGVCREVRAHLAAFLRRFPAHAAATRLNLILMAVDALMK